MVKIEMSYSHALVKMFVRVHADDLVIGKKYNIEDTYKGIFKERVMLGAICWLKFDYTYFDGYPVPPRFHFTERDTFYQLIPQAQWQMERRSVNILVRKLIGDDHFEW